MRRNLIESWALEIIDRVLNGQPFEDYRVEAKSQWIDSQKAARRLAGHANAARGASILWLIGIDEKNGVVGVDHKEFASWIDSVQSEFDSVSPSVVDVNIHIDDQTIVALYFETDRAPYIVKNPSFGSTNGTPISYEVPWREGTRVRTAKRSDLIRLLVPRLNIPEFEVLGGELNCRSRDNNLHWSLILILYIIPSPNNDIVIPFHRCEASFQFNNKSVRNSLGNITIKPPYKLSSTGSGVISIGSGVWEPDTVTIEHSRYEVIIHGPGRLNLSGDTHTDFFPFAFEETSILIDCKLFPLHSDLPMHITSILQWSVSNEDEHDMWIF